EQQGQPDLAGIPFEDRLALLVEREVTAREDRRLTRLLQLAKLRLPAAAIEDLDFRSARGLDRSLLLRLSGCDWIRQSHSVLIVGATGTGKTYLACALGQSACRHGLMVRYVRLPRLLNELGLARADGSYGKLLAALAKADLLILDDWGLAPLTDRERRDLLEVLEDRYGRRATLVTSQLPLDHWHDCVGDPTFGDAILDRLVHQAHRLILKGTSMRRQERTNPKTP
ncbi:MAG: IS21-like element helper ATPase IstB, partial [Gammaproteobacteria bacterium]